MDTRFSTTAWKLMKYLRDKPHAQDTLEGILSWWLLDVHIEEQMARVEGGLRELVAADLVVATPAPDGRRRYRLNPRRTGMIRDLLAARETGDA